MATIIPTVEHVMPQRWAEKWVLPDGRSSPYESSITAMISHKVDAAMQEQIATREQLVNAIGNLTLVTSSLDRASGTKSFTEKKTQLAGSLLAPNREIAARAVWDEAVIRERGVETPQHWPRKYRRPSLRRARHCQCEARHRVDLLVSPVTGEVF